MYHLRPLEAVGNQTSALLFEHLADEVRPVERGPGCGSHVPEQDEGRSGVNSGPAVENQVGKREVCEKAPRADQVLEVRDLLRIQIGVIAGEVNQGGHGATSLCSVLTGPGQQPVCVRSLRMDRLS